MQFLENEGLDHIKPKTALKAMVEILGCYINMDVPSYNSSFIGKITNSDFTAIKHSFYEILDSYGLGKIENVKNQKKTNYQRQQNSSVKILQKFWRKKNQKSRRWQQPELF